MMASDVVDAVRQRQVLAVAFLRYPLLQSNCYLLFACSFFLSSIASHAQDAPIAEKDKASSSNAYADETQFSEDYDRIAALRDQGKSAEALEEITKFLAEIELERDTSEPSPAAERRWLQAQALRANLLRDLNRNTEAIEANQKLLEITANADSVDDLSLRFDIQLNYARALSQAGQRQAAMDEMQNVIDGYAKLVSKAPDNTQLRIRSTTASNNFGTQLVQAGQFRQAAKIFASAIELLREIPGENVNRDQKLSLLLLNLGMTTASVGDPVQARQLIEESLALKEQLGETDSIEAIRSRITLGAILGRLNQYGESAEAYRVAVDQLRRRYPSEKYPNGTVDLAIAIDNRSVSLVRLKRLEEAVELASEANAMFAALAEQSPGLKIYHARSSANVALLNARIGRQLVALEGLTKAIELYEEMFDGTHAELPGLYRSKAIILSEMRREAESIAAAEKSLQLARDYFPKDAYPGGHWILAQGLDSTGLIYFAAGQIEKAATYFSEAVEMQASLAEQTLRYVSEAESLQFLAVADKFKSHLLSAAADNERVYQLLAGDKSRILDQQKQRFRAARLSTSPELAGLFDQYQQIRTALAKTVLSPATNPNAAQAAKNLQSQREQLERTIAGRLASNSQQQSGQPDFIPASGLGSSQLGSSDESPAKAFAESVRAVPADTRIVEFFSYEHLSINDEGESRKTQGNQRLAGFIIDGGSNEIVRLDFGEALPLRRLVRRLIAGMQFGTHAEALSELSQSFGRQILRDLPASCRRLVLIPDGIASAVPYACLANSDSESPWIQDFEITVQSSLLRQHQPELQLTPSSKMLAVGNVDYGAEEPGRPIQFVQLPGSNRELAVLREHLDSSQLTVLQGLDVKPEELLESMPDADMVHLATHAYVTDFAKNAVTNNALDNGAVRSSADQRSPLLAARMALSEANHSDGDAIITGEQFASLDLRKTQLVVLSACESGVGERVLGEGVFGLQRAFHIAGVPNVVATLWPVSDADAVLFMKHFYSALLKDHQTPAAALRSAQLAMLHAELLPQGDTQDSPTPNPLLALRRGIRFESSSQQEDADATDATQASDSSPAPISTWAAFFLSMDPQGE